MSILDEVTKVAGKYVKPLLPRNDIEGSILFALIAIPVPMTDSLWWTFAAARIGVEQAGKDLPLIKREVRIKVKEVFGVELPF